MQIYIRNYCIYIICIKDDWKVCSLSRENVNIYVENKYLGVYSESWIASKTGSNIRSRITSQKNVFNVAESIIQSLFGVSCNGIYSTRRQSKTL